MSFLTGSAGDIKKPPVLSLAVFLGNVVVFNVRSHLFRPVKQKKLK